jgi:subtilase family serine protease
MSARTRILATAGTAACALLCISGAAGAAAAAPAAAPAFPAGLGMPAVPGAFRAAGTAPVPAPPTSAECVQDLGVACYSPLQVQRAYDLPSLYSRGLNGRGRTIVIVDPFGSPTIRRDLKTFDSAFGLPAPPSLRVLQPVGPVPPFNAKNAGMLDNAGETTLDVEWSHAVAPGASILLVETPVEETVAGGGFRQFMAAENYVITHNLGDVISQSFSIPEPNFPSPSAIMRLRYAFRDAYRHQVTVLAAANDFGVTGPTPSGGAYTHPVVYWPASDPLVTGVGGTTLHLSAAGERTSPDTAFNDSQNAAVLKLAGTLPWAGGGGLSAVFARPAYQDPVRGITGNHRGVPDVALSSSLSGGVVAFESFTGAPGAWGPVGGTSEATPELAGVIAIADQYAHRRLGLINPALYRLEREHAPGLVDVTSGSNSVSFTLNGRAYSVPGYSAGPGYDLVTGTGTIDAALFVPELAGLNWQAPA